MRPISPILAAVVQTVLLFVLCFVGTGCATASIAAVGTVAGFATEAISTGSSVYRLGKLDSVDMVRLDQMETAVRGMARELKLTITREERPYPNEWIFRMEDDHGKKVDVELETRTENMCRSRIDVGWFGSEPTARLVLQRIRDRLPLPPEVRPPATSRPAWPEDPRGPLKDERRGT